MSSFQDIPSDIWNFVILPYCSWEAVLVCKAWKQQCFNYMLQDVRTSKFDFFKLVLYAVHTGNLNLIRQLSKDSRADLQIYNNLPMIMACINGNLEIVKLLVELGVDPHGPNDGHFVNSISSTYSKFTVSTPDLYLDEETDISESDSEYPSLFSYSDLAGYIHEIQPYIRSYWNAPIMTAAENLHFNIVDYLCDLVNEYGLEEVLLICIEIWRPGNPTALLSKLYSKITFNPILSMKLLLKVARRPKALLDFVLGLPKFVPVVTPKIIAGLSEENKNNLQVLLNYAKINNDFFCNLYKYGVGVDILTHIVSNYKLDYTDLRIVKTIMKIDDIFMINNMMQHEFNPNIRLDIVRKDIVLLFISHPKFNSYRTNIRELIKHSPNAEKIVKNMLSQVTLLPINLIYGLKWVIKYLSESLAITMLADKRIKLSKRDVDTAIKLQKLDVLDSMSKHPMFYGLKLSKRYPLDDYEDVYSFLRCCNALLRNKSMWDSSLIEKDINVITDWFQLSAANGFTMMVKYLLEKTRVDPSADENMALQIAIKEQHKHVIKLLLSDRRVIKCAQKYN